MFKGKFRNYELDTRDSRQGVKRDVRIFIHKGGYQIPDDEIYLEIRDWESNDGKDNIHFIGSLDGKTARELGNLLISEANSRTIVVTDRSGKSHVFVDPKSVEEK